MSDPGTEARTDGRDDLVRDALLHLYDLAYLQTHPLARLVETAPGAEGLRGKLLFQALHDAIVALHPAPGTPGDPRAWRSYRLLELRYLEALSAGEVRRQLAIERAQYQRDHARALAAVASLLRDRWAVDGEPAPDAAPRAQLARSEAEQLSGQMAPEEVQLPVLLERLVAALAPEGEEPPVRLRVSWTSDIPPVYADRAVLRQVLLGLLDAALECAGEAPVDVSVDAAQETVRITVDARRGPADAPRRSPDSPELGVARRLVGALGGELRVETEPGGHWRASVALPAAERSTLLALDNSPDFIGLVARFTAEHGWQVVGASDVRQAEALALERRPDAVLLDVMLPGQDGWELLQALRERPETRGIPVLICSVLFEPRIAAALGAAGYLPKPITQAALLQALAPWRRRARAPAPSR